MSEHSELTPPARLGKRTVSPLHEMDGLSLLDTLVAEYR